MGGKESPDFEEAMVAKCESFIIGDSGISSILVHLRVRVHLNLCTAS